MKKQAAGRIVRRGKLKVWTGPLPATVRRSNRLELALARWLVKRLGLDGAQEFHRRLDKLADAYIAEEVNKDRPILKR